MKRSERQASVKPSQTTEAPDLTCTYNQDIPKTITINSQQLHAIESPFDLRDRKIKPAQEEALKQAIKQYHCLLAKGER